jgi:hypothetical protein
LSAASTISWLQTRTTLSLMVYTMNQVCYTWHAWFMP